MIARSLRARLTLWSVAVQGLILLLISVGSYAMVGVALRQHVDMSLRSLSEAADVTLGREVLEGESLEQAAVSTTEELNLVPGQSIAIFTVEGALLSARGAIPPDRLTRQFPGAIVRDVKPGGRHYVVIVGQTGDSIAEDLEALRHALYTSVPAGLVLSALAAWFLLRKNLRPLEIMSTQARRIGARNLEERLAVANPGDELGALASSFNDLLTRLNAAFNQQRRFMADASHELRTPLSVISSAAQITLERPERPEAEYREALAIVADMARRQKQIVDDMFTLARADAGDQVVHRATVYLDEIVAETIRAARVLAAQKNVNVTLHPGPEAPYSGDEGLLRRMALNLLDNAIRYTPPCAGVSVTLAREHEEYVLTVRDQGPGVPVEAQPHVFERFYQVEAARFHDHGGSGAGLGLAIARWVAAAHGGSLVLMSSDDTGSAFVARLPILALIDPT